MSDLGKPKPNADSSTWLKDEKQQETEAEDGFKARVAKLEETAQAEQQQRPGSGVPDEFLDRILIEPVTIDEDLKLDDSGANAQQEAVFEMLTNYIDGQPDPNASLEVAHNLIKKLGRIVNRYQRETA